MISSFTFYRLLSHTTCMPCLISLFSFLFFYPLATSKTRIGYVYMYNMHCNVLLILQIKGLELIFSWGQNSGHSTPQSISYWYLSIHLMCSIIHTLNSYFNFYKINLSKQLKYKYNQIIKIVQFFPTIQSIWRIHNAFSNLAIFHA